ncbi:nucleotidyltransferase domain-containing protein [Ammoniphilus sp. YIM 78166]|uniref:nucleotidyltransferase domain-containing protein n=1 Tax=Ammoniphilus sp. YIM 78166 TaxID=1644106 RepID=UPI00106FF3B2|nr:nucleotidyltransferase domain-containing protein [Ammoniphilus sp. YIM 78166]
MLTNISELEKIAIQSLYQKIKDELKVKKIILFGSKARGTDEKYSDIDLLVLTEKPKTINDRAKLSDISADISIDYGVTLSCLYFNDKDWESGEHVNPLLKLNVEREGVEIVLQ